MRVFTHYRETNGEGVRWRTLLQFGESWEVRGSVVMKNPGAADFKDPARRAIFDPTLLRRLATFDDNPNPTINEDPGSVFDKPSQTTNRVLDDNTSQIAMSEPNTAWYEFNADATMRAVAELFNEYYALRGEKLDGVIQIFNLFYIKEVNLGKALEKNRTARLVTSGQTPNDILANPLNQFAKMAEYDIAHLVAPVYLGFAGLAKDKTCGPVARQFFDAAKALGMNYLHPDFDQNDFTHPLYLMNYGKNRPTSILLRSRFIHNSLNY